MNMKIKYLNSFILFFILNFNMHSMLGSNIIDENSYNSDTTTEGIENEDEMYIVEKPNVHWKTKYFTYPVVVKAEHSTTNPNKLTITETPPSIYFEYKPQAKSKDFIPCDGPTRDIDMNEYQDIVATYAPQLFNRIQQYEHNHTLRMSRLQNYK